MEERIERREYFRVKDVLQLSLRRLPNFEVMPMARVVGYFSSFPPDMGTAPETVDPFIARQLQTIHQKLDAILEYLYLDKSGFTNLQYHEVDISAGGMRVKVSEDFEEGDTLEIRLILPTAPPLYLICYGKVKRCSECANRKEIAIEFVNIGEDIRSLIVRYVLQRQRQDIRR
ncbi:MAG: PilZ domain-containing protein [Syntrophobacterales bacterium]|nr:PilZ domain-containing protein [Syntrophobacterales bacterium]